mmetsp:Transcript_3790/g.6632  ORF Transcript_3790/g.6632 Transcript_3790/m.6632 type:complete len:135 (+) Transcript_3790:102-506(+)
MGKVKKSVKKFRTKGHLNKAIKKRKVFNGKVNSQQKPGGKKVEVEKAADAHKEDKFSGMSPDEFLNGGFEEESEHDSSGPEDDFSDGSIEEFGSEDVIESDDDEESEEEEEAKTRARAVAQAGALLMLLLMRRI